MGRNFLGPNVQTYSGASSYSYYLCSAEVSSGWSDSTNPLYASMTQFLQTNNVPSTGRKIIPHVLYAWTYICVFLSFFFVTWLLHDPITRAETNNIKYDMQDRTVICNGSWHVWEEQTCCHVICIMIPTFT